MGRIVRNISISCLVIVLVANLAFFAFAQNGNVYSNDWIHIKVFYNPQSHYEFRGLRYFYEYLSTFPFLTNSISTVNQIAAIVSGEVVYTGYSVVDAIIGVLTVLGSTVELIFAFIADLINMLIWLFFFFVPNWF